VLALGFSFAWPFLVEEYALNRLRTTSGLTPVNTHAPRSWTGVLILCPCLMLLFPQWKNLRKYPRPRNDEQIQAKKAFSQVAIEFV
jgi:hypothetical protein